MSDYFFEPPVLPSLPVEGSEKRYAVNRIFCIGRNYVDHAKEMGSSIDKQEPTIFTKPITALVHSGSEIDYPAGTKDLHYEMELVVALGAKAFEVDAEQAKQTIFGFACGLDLTRRDLQARAKKKCNSWDLGKAFENSAVISSISRSLSIDDLDDKAITLSQNGKIKQHAKLGDMVWRVEQLVEFLSGYYHLQPGDLIFTGTPAGVGPVEKGDRLEGHIDAVGSIALRINS